MSESAGSTLRCARTRAGLTQTQLAERVGVAQSVISAYESGHRQPSVPMLTNLISATGFDLRLKLARPIDRLTGPVGRRVRRNRSKIRAIAAEHGARNVRLFGSVARGDDRPDSDVDLLVDLPPGTGLFALARLQADLEAVLDARVDLVAPGDLKPNVRRRIERDLVTL